mgnify:CR=1 FL=1
MLPLEHGETTKVGIQITAQDLNKISLERVKMRHRRVGWRDPMAMPARPREDLLDSPQVNSLIIGRF